MTKEQEQRFISALLEERAAYERRASGAEADGDEEAAAAAKERLSQVSAELARLGHEAQKPSERAVRRPGRRAAEKR